MSLTLLRYSQSSQAFIFLSQTVMLSPWPSYLASGLLGLCLMVASPQVFAADKSIKTSAVLTTEADTVLSGGLNRGTGLLNNLDLTAHWQGDNGWEAYGYILGDFGEDFSDNRTGDIQVTSNIDSIDGWRLFEAYVKKTSADDKLSVTGGLINLNDIFDVQEVGDLFLNASHGIGIDYSQSGPAIFPITGLGLVTEWQMRPHQTIRVGIFDGVPGDPNDKKRFVYIKLSAAEGSHLAGEYQYDFTGGYLKLGAWHNTAITDRLDGKGYSRNKRGAYAQLAATLYRAPGQEGQGLKGWIRAGIANDQLMPIDHYVGGGLVYTGPFKGHDSDQLGLAIAIAHFGRPYQSTADATLKSEITWEMSYRWNIKDNLSLQPDLQYIAHPSGRSDIGNATVLQMRLKIGLN